MRRFWLAMILPLGLLSPGAFADRISGYAFVNDDASLRIKHYTIHLFGVYVPPTDPTCRTFVQPVMCGSRASLALDFKICANFVDCETMEEYEDGSVAAICRVQGEDLGAWLLSQGWALALPHAPFEYAARERIATQRGIGVWGMPADLLRIPPFPR